VQYKKVDGGSKEFLHNHMSDTSTFKVLEAFELDGNTQEVGTQLELTPEQVEQIGAAKLEAVVAAE
jgi:hypothetical protein